MTATYTGPAYGGQNNLTVQGCLHAAVTHGGSNSKLLAASALKLYAQRQGNMITHEQLNTQAQTLLSQVQTLDPADQEMMAWALTALRQL